MSFRAAFYWGEDRTVTVRYHCSKGKKAQSNMTLDAIPPAQDKEDPGVSMYVDGVMGKKDKQQTPRQKSYSQSSTKHA